jgi:hypothetical protein
MSISKVKQIKETMQKINGYQLKNPFKYVTIPEQYIDIVYEYIVNQNPIAIPNDSPEIIQYYVGTYYIIFNKDFVKSLPYYMNACKRGYDPAIAIIMRGHNRFYGYGCSGYKKFWGDILEIIKKGHYIQILNMLSPSSNYIWEWRNIPECKQCFEELLKHSTTILNQFILFYTKNDPEYKKYVDMCIDEKVYLNISCNYYFNLTPPDTEKVKQIVDISIELQDSVILLNPTFAKILPLYTNNTLKLIEIFNLGINTLNHIVINYVIINVSPIQPIDMIKQLIKNERGFNLFTCERKYNYYTFCNVHNYIKKNNMYDTVFKLMTTYINNPHQLANLNGLLGRNFVVKYALINRDYLNKNNRQKLNAIYKDVIEFNKFGIANETDNCTICNKKNIMSLTSDNTCIDCL